MTRGLYRDGGRRCNKQRHPHTNSALTRLVNRANDVERDGLAPSGSVSLFGRNVPLVKRSKLCNSMFGVLLLARPFALATGGPTHLQHRECRPSGNSVLGKEVCGLLAVSQRVDND